MKLRALADLHTLRTVLREHERVAAERAAQERAALAATERGRRQFADAVGPVTRLRCHGRKSHVLPRPAPESCTSSLIASISPRASASWCRAMTSLDWSGNGVRERRKYSITAASPSMTVPWP